MLDDLERALEFAAAHEEAQLEDGVRLVHRALADALAKEGLAEIATEGKFDPHTQEALLSQPSEAEEGTVIQVLQKGYLLGDRVAAAGAGRHLGGGSSCAKCLYEVARRLEERLAGRAEEGVPQARARGAPGPEPGRARSAFKEVQGAYDVLSDPEKRKQYDRFGSTNGQPAPGAGTTFDFGDFDLGDIFGGMFNRGGGTAAAAARPARERRRGRGARLVRGRAAGRADDRARCSSSSRATRATARARRPAPRR